MKEEVSVVHEDLQRMQPLIGDTAMDQTNKSTNKITNKSPFNLSGDITLNPVVFVSKHKEMFRVIFLAMLESLT